MKKVTTIFTTPPLAENAEAVTMTAELFLGGWDRVLLPGLTAALVSFVLIRWNEWRTRRRKHAAFWHAINAELKFSGGLAASVFAEPVVEAPLYRLPRSAFETCYPQLLADGALSAAENRALMTFFNEVETLNRGLDLAADTSDPGERNQQHRRNCLKAERLAPDGPLYKEAAAAIAKHSK